MSPGREHELVERCLRRESAAWREFVDQYLPLFYHVVHHTAAQLSVPLTPEDAEDLVADVLARVVDNNFQVLRQFEGRSRLGTYLVVVARRLVLRQLRQRLSKPSAQPLPDGAALADTDLAGRREARRPETIEEIHQLLRRLPWRVRQIVRMYYLEGRTYQEISAALNIPINSIGPVLSRARRLLLERLREGEESPRNASDTPDRSPPDSSSEKAPPSPAAPQ